AHVGVVAAVAAAHGPAVAIGVGVAGVERALTGVVDAAVTDLGLRRDLAGAVAPGPGRRASLHAAYTNSDVLGAGRAGIAAAGVSRVARAGVAIGSHAVG